MRNSTKFCHVANKRDSPYVAAEIQNYDALRSLTIGDGRSYGGHLNAPLEVSAVTKCMMTLNKIHITKI